jgi:DNA replication and repair protein RecF
MALRSVRLQDFRCFDTVDFELDSRVTLFRGPNGSGKTSLLEAIFFLGRGRSFRTARADSVVRHGQPRLVVSGLVEQGPVLVPLAAEHGGGETVGHLRSERVASLAELSAALPVQVIDPSVHKLIEEGPLRRRRLIDWGVFHVEPGYLATWQRFHRALRQRNAALQQRAVGNLDVWDEVLVSAAEQVSAARTRYLAQSTPYLLAACQSLLGSAVSIRYLQGWSAEHDMVGAIERARATDYQRRTTTVGPHRADLVIETGQGLAKAVVSRGQQKLLAAGLILGQLEFHIAQHALRPTLLLDDPAAELDQDSVYRFSERASRLDAQLVLTSLSAQLPGLVEPNREFHVEQGRIRQML